MLALTNNRRYDKKESKMKVQPIQVTHKPQEYIREPQVSFKATPQQILNALQKADDTMLNVCQKTFLTKVATFFAGMEKQIAGHFVYRPGETNAIPKGMELIEIEGRNLAHYEEVFSKVKICKHTGQACTSTAKGFIGRLKALNVENPEFIEIGKVSS